MLWCLCHFPRGGIINRVPSHDRGEILPPRLAWDSLPLLGRCRRSRRRGHQRGYAEGKRPPHLPLPILAAPPPPCHPERSRNAKGGLRSRTGGQRPKARSEAEWDLGAVIDYLHGTHDPWGNQTGGYGIRPYKNGGCRRQTISPSKPPPLGEVVRSTGEGLPKAAPINAPSPIP